MENELEEEYDLRRGPGISWRMVTSHSILEGYTLDDLDKKSLNQAKDSFERLFISIRGVLESNGSRCLDEEEERLQICQDLSQYIKKNYKQIFQK